MAPNAAPAGFTAQEIASLQGTIGNAAVAGLLESPSRPKGAVQSRTLVPSPWPTVQREVPDGADTSKLDSLIARVGAECDAFGIYKQNPLLGNAMPGQKIQVAVSRWDGGSLEPWMRGYVTEKMGPLRLKLLNEMISMSGVGWPDYELLFDVSYQRAEHKYTLELKGETTIIGKALAKLAPTVTVRYTNAFAWDWHRDYSLAGAEMSASVSKDAKKKAKGGLSGGPITLDISGSALASPVPIRYCGGADFTGAFTVVKGAAKGHIGPLGGTLGAFTGITFHGTPEGDVSFLFSDALSASVSGGSTTAGIDVGFGGGVGTAVGRGETEVTPPPRLAEVNKLGKAFRQWEAVIGPFDTGAALVIPDAAAYLDGMHTKVYNFKQQKLDPMAENLRSQSVDPDRNFQLSFEVVGMASRRWASAGTGADRQKRNEELSLRRASAVETEINNRFADVRNVTKKGAGASVVGPTPGDGGPAPMLDDAQAEQLFEEKKKEALAEPDPATRRDQLKAVAANYGPNADQQAARRVYVFCVWEGLMNMRVLVPVISSSAP